MRVDIMIKDGLVDETKNLLSRHGRIKNLVNTIGYQEIIEYLDGNLSIDNAIEQAISDSKNNEMPAVFHRKNRKKWLVTISLEDFMKLYKEKGNESIQRV